MIESLRISNRVLVERGDDLDARRRVVDLVKDAPEAIFVAEAVPPVEEEGADQPRQEALQRRHAEAVQAEERRAGEVAVPHPVQAQGDDELAEVHPEGAGVPAGDVRERAAGAHALEDEEEDGGGDGAEGCEVHERARGASLSDQRASRQPCSPAYCAVVLSEVRCSTAWACG
ncbi:MAG: hypothetical protein QM820_06245 [Minicystis sp.]